MSRMQSAHYEHLTGIIEPVGDVYEDDSIDWENAMDDAGWIVSVVHEDLRVWQPFTHLFQLHHTDAGTLYMLADFSPKV